MKGTYRITMALPAWTVENLLTLEPLEGGMLEGCLDTGDGTPPIPFTHARWNKQYFQIQFSVGPGQLQLTGSVQGNALSGVVVIDNTPDRLSGSRIREDTETEEKGKRNK